MTKKKKNDVIVGRNPTAISKSICHTTQNIFQMKKKGRKGGKENEKRKNDLILGRRPTTGIGKLNYLKIKKGQKTAK